MKPFTPLTRASLAGMFVLAVWFGPATPVQAQITFGLPTTISADTDVFNGGTPLYAYGFGSGGTVGASIATVNGVNFLNAGTVNNGSLSNANLSITGFQGNFPNSGAPTGVSSAYRSVLNNSIFIGGGFNNGILTLMGLTAGNRYSVQLWADDSTSGNNGSRRQETVTDGGSPANSVTLFSNSGTGNAGSAGQYVLGNFTATGTTQVVRFTQSTGAAYLNMVSVESVVPEPATWALMLGGTGLLAVAQRLRRRVR